MRSFALARTAAVGAVAIVAALSFTACATEPAPTEASALEIPLITSGPDGTQYRLSNPTFVITGPTSQTVVANGDEESFQVSLAPGLYDVRLIDGWSIEHTRTDGTVEVLPAILGSHNPQQVRVFADTRAFLFFDFFIRNQNGTLTVSFGVDPQPRQIVGALRPSTGTGVFAAYAGQVIDYSFYFTTPDQATETTATGERVRNHYVGSIAAEFFNDAGGVLAGAVAADLTGGYLEYSSRLKADGTAEARGDYTGYTGAVHIVFGPNPIGFLQADETGYPRDANFNSFGPFTLEYNDGTQTSTLSGTARFRQTLQ